MNRTTTKEVFSPKRTNQSYLLSRARPVGKDPFDSFVSPQDGFEVFIHDDVLRRISQESDYAAPYETMGLLAGRVWRDEKGLYTVVLAAKGATRDQVEATASHVRISANEMSQLREDLEIANPALEIVGWYHSHPRFTPFYSAEDKTEQSTWSDPNHVGIVVSGLTGSEKYGVYRGPDAIRLVRRGSEALDNNSGNDVFQPRRPRPSPSPDTTDVKVLPPFTPATERQDQQPVKYATDDSGMAEPTTRMLSANKPGMSKTVKLLIVAITLAVIAPLAVMFWMSNRLAGIEQELKKRSQPERQSPQGEGSNGEATPQNDSASKADPASRGQQSDAAQAESTGRQKDVRVAPQKRAASRRPRNRPASNVAPKPRPKSERANKPGSDAGKNSNPNKEGNGAKQSAPPNSKPAKE